MKNKIKSLLKQVAVALLARADAAVTKLLMKLVPQGTPTLESIISTFDVAASQLADFEARQRNVVEQHEAEIERLAKAQRELAAAANRAARIKDRLSDLVS